MLFSKLGRSSQVASDASSMGGAGHISMGSISRDASVSPPEDGEEISSKWGRRIDDLGAVSSQGVWQRGMPADDPRQTQRSSASVLVVVNILRFKLGVMFPQQKNKFPTM